MIRITSTIRDFITHCKENNIDIPESMTISKRMAQELCGELASAMRYKTDENSLAENEMLLKQLNKEGQIKVWCIICDIIFGVLQYEQELKTLIPEVVKK